MQYIPNTLETMSNIIDTFRLLDDKDDKKEMWTMILEQAAKTATQKFLLSDLQGDTEGAVHDGKGVKVPAGFHEGYRQYGNDGWLGLSVPEIYGGSGMHYLLSTASQEYFSASNMALSLCPMLTQGVIDLLIKFGTKEQQEKYLGNLLSGKWSGTMNLTEPHAGTDLGLIKTKAIKQDDGTYRIFGQKIYITFGDHDMSENIIHAVLARTDGAPEGTKGLSLFLVPKIHVDGSNQPNDVRCISIENKLGIHGSPTCTMIYGDRGEGAVAYLLGKELDGMSNMFEMMNAARLAVGLQGVAIAERARQMAISYANQRQQGKNILDHKEKAPTLIINHPDVERMINLSTALTRIARSIVLKTALEVEIARSSEDPVAKKNANILVEYLTPVAKAFATDVGSEVADLNIQVHGGMGFIEDTRAAQLYRDIRISRIYEGTNGVQAMDLIGRKLVKDQGAAVRLLVKQMNAEASSLTDGLLVLECANMLSKSTQKIAEYGLGGNLHAAASLAVDYLNIVAITVGTWLVARQRTFHHDDGPLKADLGMTMETIKERVFPRAKMHFDIINNMKLKK